MPEAPGDGAPAPEARAPHPVSRARAAANTILFIAAGLTLLGWLNIVFNVGHWEEARIARLATWVAYGGFIAFIAFVASLVLILVENRVTPNEEGSG